MPSREESKREWKKRHYLEHQEEYRERMRQYRELKRKLKGLRTPEEIARDHQLEHERYIRRKLREQGIASVKPDPDVAKYSGFREHRFDVIMRMILEGKSNDQIRVVCCPARCAKVDLDDDCLSWYRLVAEGRLTPVGDEDWRHRDVPTSVTTAIEAVLELKNNGTFEEGGYWDEH